MWHRQDSAGYRLVKAWLDVPPTSKMEAVWQDYIDHILSSVAVKTRTAIGEDTMLKAKRIADAASLTFDFHRVEKSQLRVLQAIEVSVFSHAVVEPCS